MMLLYLLATLLGSCCGDAPSASLLQLASKGQLVSMATKAGSDSAALTGFQNYAQSLVAKYSRDGEQPDSDTLQAIDVVIEWIDSIYSHLLAAHQMDADDADVCAADGCAPNATAVEIVVALQALVVTERGLHRACRKEEVECTSSVTQACAAYHSYRLTDLALLTLEAPCALTGALSDEFIAADDDPDLTTMETCLRSTKEWHEALYEKYAACKRAPCVLEPPQCVTNQTEFEATHCDWTIASKGLCDTTDVCETRQESRCTDLARDIAIRVSARKADNETGERIKCLLLVLRDEPEQAKPGALRSCTLKLYDTDDFNITCTVPEASPPPDLDCGAHGAVSCSPAFLTSEYSEDVFKHLKHSECHQCLAGGGDPPPEAFWPQWSAAAKKCKDHTVQVDDTSQLDCQNMAVASDVSYYSWRSGGRCQINPTCEIVDSNGDHAIYKKPDEALSLLSDGTYTVQQKVNNRYLDAHESSSGDYSVVTRTAQNNPSQQWLIKSLGANLYTVQQKVNNRYMDAHESSSGDYSVVTRAAQGDNSQRWLIKSVEEAQKDGEIVLHYVSSCNQCNIPWCDSITVTNPSVEEAPNTVVGVDLTTLGCDKVDRAMTVYHNSVTKKVYVGVEAQKAIKGDIVVEDAGYSACNGQYVYAGKRNGEDSWQKSTGQIYWNSHWGWGIGCGGHHRYSSKTCSSSDPTTCPYEVRKDEQHPDRDGALPIPSLSIKDDTFELLGKGVCRTASGSKGTYDAPVAATEAECRAACSATSTCVAFEWKERGQECERHSEAISGFEAEDRHVCYVRKTV